MMRGASPKPVDLSYAAACGGGCLAPAVSRSPRQTGPIECVQGIVVSLGLQRVEGSEKVNELLQNFELINSLNSPPHRLPVPWR